MKLRCTTDKRKKFEELYKQVSKIILYIPSNIIEIWLKNFNKGKIITLFNIRQKKHNKVKLF